MKTEMNPWAGLASYQDPAAGSTLLFCGRDNESYDLAALADDNIFCTLYGKSGTGKTSLLNAGVFPRLREMGYLPLSIRLGMEAMGTTFQQCVATRLGKVAVLETVDTVPLPVDDQDEQWLWAWFARTRFVDAEGKVRFPVLVFDQFEEVFRSRRAEAETLLRQIHFMMDPSHSLGDDYDYNFRFLASIREDDLYLLEDSLDRHFMGDMKQCRYRLNSLTDEGAREVILKPGEGLFAAGEQDAIVDTVIGIARSADGSINTNILSLVCSRIYDHYKRSGDSNISLDLVRRFVSSNPFEQFYNEVTADLSEREKQFIEDRLVDAAGRRGSVSEPDFEKNVPNGAHLLEGTGRILQRVASGTEGRSYRIELIHDSFCAPLADQKLKRAARRRRRVIAALSAVALVVAAIAAYIVVASIRNARQTREILIQQEKFYAKQASQLLDEGDTYTALLLLNELTDPDGPFAKIPLQPEAERQMRRAIQMHDEAEWKVECVYQIPRGLFKRLPQVTPNGKYLVESTVGALMIYDFHTGQLLRKVRTDSYNNAFPSFSISHDSKTIVYYDYDEWNIPSGVSTVNIESGEVTSLDFRKFDGENYVYFYYPNDAVFSNDDDVIFYLMDTTICLYPYQRKSYFRARSLKDSTEFYLQNGEDVTVLETGNSDGTRVAGMKQSGEILIYDKSTRELLTTFHPGDCDIWKYISDDIMLFVKKDGLYKYTISKKKFEKILTGYYDCKLLMDIQVSADCFCISQMDTVFIYDRKTFALRNTYVIDRTKYIAASLCNGGKLLLVTKNQKKIALISHNPKETPQKIKAKDDVWEMFIDNGCFHVSTTYGIPSNRISVFQIRDVETNAIVFSDTTTVQRDIESISPNEKYILTLEWATLLDANGDTVFDEAGSEKSYWKHDLFDVKQMKWIHTFDTSDFKRDVYFTNQDNIIIYPKNYGKRYYYDINTGENNPFYADSLTDSVSIYSLTVNRNTDNMIVLSSGYDKTFFINSKKHRLIEVSNEEYNDGRFTPDGKHILTLAKDNTLRLHKASNFKVIDSCNSDLSQIRAIHPDGKMCVAISSVGKLELWSLFPLRKIADNVGDGLYSVGNWNDYALVFCDDGKNIVFYSEDQDKFFKIPIPSQQEVIERARKIVRDRRLTEEEKKLLME